MNDSVYYYDDSSQQVLTLAKATPAPDGVSRVIEEAQPAGDWVEYVETDPAGGHWSLHVVNPTTREDRLIDSYLEEHSSATAQWFGRVASDGSTLVWSADLQDASSPDYVLRSYDFSSGGTSTLMSGPNTPIVAPEAMWKGALLLLEKHISPQSSDGLYLWIPGGAPATQISSYVALNASFNDQYVVWDVVENQTLSLYDRATGQTSTNWVKKCIRPAIAQDRPYVVCLEYDYQQLVLAQTPSGEGTAFAGASAGQAGEIANNRVYWVEASSSGFNNVVDYFDLPTG